MSHHYSSPNWGFPHGDARLDLTDLYAFPKPGDAGKSILIMNVRPSVRDYLDGENPVIAGLGHLRLPTGRDRRPLNDSLPAVARPGGLRAFNAAQRRGLRPALGGREAHAVRDIGDGIFVRVNLELIERLGGEGLGGGGPQRVLAVEVITERGGDVS